MPRATNPDGSLAYLTAPNPDKNCRIITPCGTICLKIVPDISDGKAATYPPENAIGRTNPILTFAHSEPRTITTGLHFMITITDDINYNWWALRIIQSLVYPQPPSGIAPYTPPPVVRFICGDLMDGENGLCLILKSYNVTYPTDVAWETNTFLPYKFTITCNWEVVYSCQNQPYNLCNTNQECNYNSQCQTITNVYVPYVSSASKTVGGATGMALAPAASSVGFVKRSMWNG